MVLSQVGVSLACIEVALFQVWAALATPKVHKSPPLDVQPVRIRTDVLQPLLAPTCGPVHCPGGATPHWSAILVLFLRFFS